MSYNLENEIRVSFDLNAKNYLSDDKHWGDDSDLICIKGKALQKTLNRLIDIFYAGVGPGYILSQIVSKQQIFRKITAIDYSSNMIKLAHDRLNEHLSNNRFLKNKVNIKLKDLLKYSTNDKYDMAILINNTLGNIVVGESAEEGRLSALIRLNRLLRPKGYLFLSVYNILKMPVLNGFYTPKLKILKKIGEQDLLLQLIEKNCLFYTHWFSINEIEDLLNKTNFTIVDVNERKERLIIYAQKH